jgi:hypothetical protein
MKYFKRLLGLPFFMGLLAISVTWQFILKSFLWMKYGGEAVNYNDKMNRKTISDVFYKLQDK